MLYSEVSGGLSLTEVSGGLSLDSGEAASSAEDVEEDAAKFLRFCGCCAFNIHGFSATILQNVLAEIIR